MKTSPNRDDLPPSIRRWLYYEQKVNERIYNRKVVRDIKKSSIKLSPDYFPEAGKVWEIECLFLPRSQTRDYGNYRQYLTKKLAFSIPPKKSVIFIHPESKKAYQSLIRKYKVVKSGLWGTPTSSFRSLLVWNPKRPGKPIILKLSLCRFVGGQKRDVREWKVVASLFISEAIKKISQRRRRRIGFDFFPEVGGSLHKGLGFGYLIRLFPQSMERKRCSQKIVPLFSLYSKEGKRSPLLVRQIRKSRRKPISFLHQKIIKPYVKVTAYLLFKEGLVLHINPQNIFLELNARGQYTGRLLYRDISDIAMNIALRLALGKPLPIPDKMDKGFSTSPALTVHSDKPSEILIGNIEGFGLEGVLWDLHRSLRRYFPKLKQRDMKEIYLKEWQKETVRYLNILPDIFTGFSGIAVAEAVEMFCLNRKWEKRGCPGPKHLPFKKIFSLTPLLAKRGKGIRSFVPTRWGWVVAEEKALSFIPISVTVQESSSGAE